MRHGNLEAFNVEIDKKKCSCRQWQISGIPCPHSITAMYFLNMNPDDFVSDAFRLSTYKKVYSFNIKPVKGSDQWKKVKHTTCLPPVERRMPGRPRIARKKDKSELNHHVARHTRVMTCQNCYRTGHTKATCVYPTETKPTKEPKKNGRPLVEDPVNARVPISRKRGRGGMKNQIYMKNQSGMRYQWNMKIWMWKKIWS